MAGFSRRNLAPAPTSCTRGKPRGPDRSPGEAWRVTIADNSTGIICRPAYPQASAEHIAARGARQAELERIIRDCKRRQIDRLLERVGVRVKPTPRPWYRRAFVRACSRRPRDLADGRRVKGRNATSAGTATNRASWASAPSRQRPPLKVSIPCADGGRWPLLKAFPSQRKRRSRRPEPSRLRRGRSVTCTRRSPVSVPSGLRASCFSWLQLCTCLGCCPLSTGQSLGWRGRSRSRTSSRSPQDCSRCSTPGGELPRSQGPSRRDPNRLSG